MTVKDRRLSDTERDRLAAYREATGLANLVELTGADSEHRAYVEAKAEWSQLREHEIDPPHRSDGIPGISVRIGNTTFWVHGITHANTSEEGDFLRERVSRYVADGGAVYCEQGIRSMYFSSLPAVCEMDDYRWAMRECRRLGDETVLDEIDPESFDGVHEEIDSVMSSLRDTALSLVESGRPIYGDWFERALGDVVSELFSSHEDLATGASFQALRLRRQAATDPSQLHSLQEYYETAFLPQPVEREWLARHDRELEIMTHARNARIADYALYHAENAQNVHLIVGAAHQPGVRYYLERLRENERTIDGFQPVA